MSLEAKRDRGLAGLPPMNQIIRGSLMRYVHDGCKCHPNGRYVYWYLSVNQGGRTRMRKLQDHQVPAVRAAIENYRRWWKTCLKIFEINTQIALEVADKKEA